MEDPIIPSTINLELRFACREDFAAMYKNCFAEAPQHRGDPIFRQIEHEWNTFTWSKEADANRRESSVTFVVENVGVNGARGVCGCAQIVFVSEAFAESIIARPRPGINMEAANEDVVHLLNNAQVEEANSGTGLNALITRWHSGTRSRFAEQFRLRVQTRLYQGIMSFFLGYRFQRLIGETNGPEAKQLAEESGFTALPHHEPPSSASSGEPQQYGTVYINRRLAYSKPSAHASHLFNDFQVPRLHLNLESRELLQLAVLGYSDSTIAGLLGRQLSAIRKRWHVLSALEASYKQVSDAVSDRLGMDVHDESTRQRWIRFAKNHPEELRPHDGEYFRRSITKPL